MLLFDKYVAELGARFFTEALEILRQLRSVFARNLKGLFGLWEKL